jgi:para-nitrobenzyl esterase
VATDLAGDRFIGHSTWRWLDRHGRTGGCPVYRYYFTRMRPSMRPELGEARSGFAGGVIRGKAGDEPMGAVHSAEIEYALGNLEGNRVYAWEEEDYAVSRVMQGYFERFIRSGNPNGGGGVEWPAANAGGGVRLMRLDVEPGVEVALRDDRYRFLDGQPFRL